MTDEALTRFPGVYERPDSKSYQFCLRAPKALAEHYPTGWAVRCSLETADLREANRKAKQLHEQWAKRFQLQQEGAASGTATTIAVRTTEPVDLRSLRRKLLERLEGSLDHLDAQAAPLTAPEKVDRAATWRWQRADVQQGLASDYVPDWLEDWLARESIALGVGRSALIDRELMKHYVGLAEVIIESLTDDTGAFRVRVQQLAVRRAVLGATEPMVPRPAAAPAASTMQQQDRYIADAFALWEGEKARLPKTVEAFKRHAAMFAQMMGDPPLATWTRATARTFRDALTSWARTQGKTARTADNVLVSIRAIAKVAHERDWLEGDVFSGLSIEIGGRELASREPWSPEELDRLFADPIWTARALPLDAKAGGAAVRIPVLMDTQFGDVVRQFGATTAPTTSSNCG